MIREICIIVLAVCVLKLVGRAGFEPATFRLSVERSSRAELPAHMREHNI